MSEIGLKDRNGAPIRLGDRAFHVGEDDGQIYTGVIRLKRVQWSEKDQRDLGVPAVMEDVVLEYDEDPRCQDDRECVYVDQILDAVEVGEPSAALRQVSAFAKAANDHASDLYSAMTFATAHDGELAGHGFPGGVAWLRAWMEGDEAAVALLDHGLGDNPQP